MLSITLSAAYDCGLCFEHKASVRMSRPITMLMMLGLTLWLVFGVALPAIAQTPTVTTLYSFLAEKDGCLPNGLIQGADGNFYGTTHQGGAHHFGTVFRETPSGYWKWLYSFRGPTYSSESVSDGAYPLAGLIQGKDGNFYGTISQGGFHGFGTVFKVTPDGSETVLYYFHGQDGIEPNSLILGADGNFYGTTYQGGAYKWGTVFKLTPAGSERVLCSFSMEETDGGMPRGLIQGKDGNFYVWTTEGGAYHHGTIFKVSPSGYKTLLYAFRGSENGSDGANPSGLIQGKDGNFYGTTGLGGINDGGTIFRLTPSGSETVLHRFGGPPADGYGPLADLLQGPDGNFYGTTAAGGSHSKPDYLYCLGTVFKMTPAGSVTVLYSFQGSDGSYPEASLIQGRDGNFYGTSTGQGIDDNNGTVFRLSGLYPVPILNSISPTSRSAGGSAFLLILTGSHFQPFSTVNWNDSPLATTYISATQLKVIVPASLIAMPGQTSITVGTGGGGTSNDKTFPILDATQ